MEARAHHVEAIQHTLYDSRRERLNRKIRHVLWYRNMLRQGRLIERYHIWDVSLF